RLLIADAAVRFKYKDRDAMGYQIASPPGFYNGTLYMGLAQSERHIQGGLVAAIDGATGSVKWVFNTIPQRPADEGWEIAQDTWVLDLVTGRQLFDVPASGRTIKGVATAGKNCFLYLYHRENGQPINPIVETAVPTKTDVPGEEPWPTQPFPYTSKGVPMQPF